MKKILCILLCALFCFSLCSCSFIIIGGRQEESGSTSAETEAETEPPSVSSGITGRFDAARAEAESALASAGTGNFDGMMFMLVCSNVYSAFGDSDGALVLPREKYARIKTLNDRLNTDIIISEASYDEIASGLMENENSGMVFAQLLDIEICRVGTLAHAGLLGNINALPFIDLTKPYYDAEFCEEMTTPAGLFCLWGDATLDENEPRAVYYNERIALEAEVTGLEDAVRAGEWDLDMFAECVKAANNSADIGSYSGSIMPDTADFLHSAYIGSGMQSVKRADDKLTLIDNKAQTGALIGRLKELLKLCVVDTEDYYNAEYIFMEGGGLFYAGRLSGVLEFYSMEDTWGLLPMPKTGEGEEYRTAMPNSTQVICYPSSGVIAVETYAVIDSLFAASYKILDAALRDDYLHYYARRPETMEMLDIVLGGVRFDLLDAYGDAFPNARAAVFGGMEQSYWDKIPYSERFDKLQKDANAELSSVKKP